MSLSPLQFRGSNIPAVNNNVNTNYANPTNSHYPGGFGSNVNPNSIAGLQASTSNVNAANSSKIMSGGKKKKRTMNLMRKIKNIVNKYRKMKGGRKITMRNLKKRFSLYKKGGLKKTQSKNRNIHKNKKRGTLRQRGGYHQYGSNIPNTPSYSTGGHLNPSLSALANPIPFQGLSRLVNGVDNYNHVKNSGFQLWN